MSEGEIFTFLLLFTGSLVIARPISNLVDCTITKLRRRREASIQLPSDENSSTTKPLPLVALSVAGLLGQIFMVVTVLHTRYWHYTAGTFFWLFVQIAYIIVHLGLLLLAISYPTQIALTATCTFPFSWPIFSLKRTLLEDFNPGAAIQTSSLVIFVLPFIASMRPYSWYNWFYWRNAGFTAQTLCGVTQQLIALVVFVYGTVVRQVYEDRRR